MKEEKEPKKPSLVLDIIKLVAVCYVVYLGVTLYFL